MLLFHTIIIIIYLEYFLFRFLVHKICVHTYIKITSFLSIYVHTYIFTNTYNSYKKYLHISYFSSRIAPTFEREYIYS